MQKERLQSKQGQREKAKTKARTRGQTIGAMRLEGFQPVPKALSSKYMPALTDSDSEDKQKTVTRRCNETEKLSLYRWCAVKRFKINRSRADRNQLASKVAQGNSAVGS